MTQPGGEAGAGGQRPPEFIVMPLGGLTAEGLRKLDLTLTNLGVIALYGDAAAATEFIASHNAPAPETDPAPAVHYASYTTFQGFGKEHYTEAAAFRIWRRLRNAGTYYPHREAAESAPDYNKLELPRWELGNAVDKYLRIVRCPSDRRAGEEIDLTGVHVLLKALLKDGYSTHISPISGLNVTSYSMLADFANKKLQLDPPLPLYRR